MPIYTYDCEFLEQGPERPLSLISLGIVCSDGRELYRQHTYADWTTIRHLEDRWLHEHVLPHLAEFNLELGLPAHYPITWDEQAASVWRTRERLRTEIMAFMDPAVHGKIERLVGYFADYDHVILCQIFGRMTDLPKGYPMWTWDLKQWAMDRGIEWLGREVRHDVDIDGPEHHALSDARWIMRAYRWAMEQEGRP